MSYVRILEFGASPPGSRGEWYERQGGGAVCIERADAPFTTISENGARAPTTWNGVRIYQCGSERKGSLLFMLKYPVPCEFHDEFDAWF